MNLMVTVLILLGVSVDIASIKLNYEKLICAGLFVKIAVTVFLFC